MKLTGTNALVTGASGGLGAAIARACAAHGATVTITGRNEANLRQLAGDIGADVIIADLTDRADVTRLIDAAHDVDILISNAALPAGGRVETFTMQEMDRRVGIAQYRRRILWVVVRDGQEIKLEEVNSRPPPPGSTSLADRAAAELNAIAATHRS
jgi:NAD(P)-dependent dehydrogenase (short-subunit alcohol dehydrogenase family)